jgi:hypothetical protein
MMLFIISGPESMDTGPENMDTLKIGVQNSSSLLSSSTVIMIGDKS